MLDLLSILACAAWLLVCLAADVVWVRSYWVADSIWSNRANDVRALILSRGSVRFYRQVVLPTAPFRVMANQGHHAQPAGAGEGQLSESGLATAWDHFGFGYAAGSDPYGWRRIVQFPCWAVVASGLVPVGWLVRRRLRRLARLRAQNRCVRCGYDLRATPDRCPECGTAVPVRAG
jgi:hypothetical protein